MIRLAKIAAIVMGAGIVGVVAVVVAAAVPKMYSIAIAAVLSFIAIVSLIKFGNKEKWIVVAGHWVDATLLSTGRRLAVVNLLLLGVLAASVIYLIAIFEQENFYVLVLDAPTGGVLVDVQHYDDNRFVSTGLRKRTNDAGVASFLVPTTSEFYQVYITARRAHVFMTTRRIIKDATAFPYKHVVPYKEIANEHWTIAEEEAKFARVDIRKVTLNRKRSIDTVIVRQSKPFKEPPWGLPESAPKLVYRKHHILGFDPKMKLPLWVVYDIAIKRRSGPRPRRPRFAADREIDADNQAGTFDYRSSGYDRGQLISAADFWLSGFDDGQSPFLYTTIVPQTPDTNRSTWLKIEEYTRAMSRKYGRITIIAGPAFVGDKFILIGPNKLPVPTHLFRVLVRETGRGRLPLVLAFLVPNTFQREKDIAKFLVSVGDIEKATSLRFFARMPDASRRDMIAAKPSRLWE